MTNTIVESVNFEKIKIDNRLDLINLPKGLIESIKNAGFTIEMIMNTHTSNIAQILGIDDYVAQIIYQETKYYYQMNEIESIS
ncbi:MAG TPA: hypothetical protein VJ697_12655 [Nitrososphaeraceae archaeon]|nr:hypothetical protein [Nitrososphaeraceae archaeon]